jgi:D-3-phosphoglycerate dehydrogenase
MLKIFIATSSFSELSPSLINKFKKKKIIFKKNPLNKKLTPEQLVKYAKDCEYIVAGTEVYNEETLDKLTKLKFIYRLGSGVDNLDLVHIKKNKIKFTKSKTTPEIAVAELIIGYILSIYRNINDHNNNLKKKFWKKKMGYTLNKKTIGIIGYGKVGKYLYKILKNFGVKILVNDKKKINVKNTNLKSLIQNSDIISINTNLTSKKKILNKKNLRLCKKNCVIINTSRPEVIDYDYLYLMLKKKKILGAGIDVFNQEPYFGKLTSLDNVILTPHIGSYSKEVRSQMEKEALVNIFKRYNLL